MELPTFRPGVGGGQHIILQQFSEKLHEIEKILVRKCRGGGGGPRGPPLLDVIKSNTN